MLCKGCSFISGLDQMLSVLKVSDFAWADYFLCVQGFEQLYANITFKPCECDDTQMYML